MALTDGQMAQLAQVLHGHAIQFEDLLSAQEFWTHNLHVPVATQLRVLLCDRDLPVLLTFANERRIPLRIWGPRPAGSSLDPQIILSWTAFVASWTPLHGGHEMSIQEYLDTDIAVIPVGQEGMAFSPRQIIKWVANKEGGAHFSFEKPATLSALNQTTLHSGDVAMDSFHAKQVLQALGHWTHTAIGACLGIVPLQGT